MQSTTDRSNVLLRHTLPLDIKTQSEDNKAEHKQAQWKAVVPGNTAELARLMYTVMAITPTTVIKA